MFQGDSIPFPAQTVPDSGGEFWHTRSFDTTGTLQSITFPQNHGERSFFTGHTLKTDQIKPTAFTQSQPDWITVILILCFILLAWVQVFDRYRLSQIFRAPMQKRFFSQLFREGNLFTERISFALGIIYLLSVTLLTYTGFTMLIGPPPFGLSNLNFFLLAGSSLLLYWCIKVFFIRLLGTVFRTSVTTREYLLNILVFNMVCGIILLPVLVVIIYMGSPLLLYAGLIIISLVIILRFIRGFLIGISLTRFSYLYLFVYLCSLEILPLIVLLRFFLNHIHIAIRMN